MPFVTVDAAFEELLRRIELNPARVSLASQRYNAVKSTIEGSLPGKTVTQVGSFQRKTKIRPADLGDSLDVDVVVSFRRFTEYARDGRGVSPGDALEIVRKALAANQTYRVMTPQKDHPVVTLTYADDMSIELTPAFVDATGAHPHPGLSAECYVVGSASGAWVPADYDYDALMISSLNGRSGKKLIPMIKLVKAYFRNAKVSLKSFHTELLVSGTIPSIVNEWNEKNYSYGYQFLLAEFLRRASRVMTNPVQLPGSYSPPLNSGLSQLFLASLGTFLSGRADVAWKICAIKSTSEAVAEWRAFFGEPFPT